MHSYLGKNTSITVPSGGFEVLFTAPHRFSFNGQESDSEVKGEGNQQDYGARIYDPRLGRWLSVDPYSIKYPNLAPYISFENSPICIIDPGGDTTIYYSQSGKLLHISYDKLPTAITIVSNRNVVRFIRQLQYARSKNLESNKGVNNLWRSYGRSFVILPIPWTNRHNS